MNIAVFGGSFNPPHRAHLHLADEFAESLRLDKMLIIPAFLPPHKASDAYAGAQDRLNMCRLLFSDKKYTVSDIEIKRQGKSYTVETLEELEKEYPGANFYLIIGSDMLLSFHKWYRFGDILRKCTLCVMTRENGISEKQMTEYAKNTLSLGEKELIVSCSAPYEMSSTQIRELIRKNEDVSPYLSEEVENYIREKRLYI